MTIIDISREIFSSPLYPGTMLPSLEVLNRISITSAYHLSVLHADLHTGTHIDAPLHFLEHGSDIASENLDKYVGPCSVVEQLCDIPRQAPSILLLRNQSAYPLNVIDCEHLRACGIKTIGTDALSLTTPAQETEVHRYLLSANMGIIENLDLSKAPCGSYFLVAAPIKISGAEASFCRAILIKHVNIL